jgi:hypothetical protein
VTVKLLRFALVVAALAVEAWADDPKPPPPVVPVASIVVPAKQPLVLYLDGTVSKRTPGQVVDPKIVDGKLVSATVIDSQPTAAWQVIEPTGVVTRTEGSAFIIPEWTPGQKYTLVLTAVGDTVPPYVFRFATVTAPGANPTPKPDPVPVPDTPIVPPAPTDGIVANMRVLVLYESTDKMTADQNAALISPAVRDYLTAKTTKNAAGFAEWRFWDKDVETANSSPEWQAAMAAARANTAPLPKVVVFSGTTLVDAKPIVDVAGTLAYLKSKGGN